MPKVSQYHNTSLLFKVLMVLPESNDTILSRINPKYYHNVQGFFSTKDVVLKSFMHYTQHLLINTQRYINLLMH